jgi:hypothetical protein
VSRPLPASPLSLQVDEECGFEQDGVCHFDSGGLERAAPRALLRSPLIESVSPEPFQFNSIRAA